MRGDRHTGWAAKLLVLLAVLSLSGATALADSDCWCAQFVGLQDDVPVRGTSVFLRIVASAALTGGTFWAVDALGLPNAQWYKISALVSGTSNIASALADLTLPTRASIDRDEQEIARSTLSETLCADTLTGYASDVRTHRYLSGAIGIGSGIAQLALLSPTGRYATGSVLDYVFLITGGIDILGGLIDVLFSTRFERDVRDAREACGQDGPPAKPLN